MYSIFRTVLSSQQDWVEGHMPSFSICPLPVYMHSLPYYQQPPTRVVHLLQLMMLHWRVVIPSKTIVYFRAHSWDCTFYGFGQMHDIIQSSFPSLKILWTVCFHPSPLSPWPTDLFTIAIVCLLQNVIELDHWVWWLFRLALSLCNMHWSFHHVIF